MDWLQAAAKLWPIRHASEGPSRANAAQQLEEIHIRFRTRQKHRTTNINSSKSYRDLFAIHSLELHRNASTLMACWQCLKSVEGWSSTYGGSIAPSKLSFVSFSSLKFVRHLSLFFQLLAVHWSGHWVTVESLAARNCCEGAHLTCWTLCTLHRALAWQRNGSQGTSQSAVPADSLCIAQRSCPK